MQMTLDGSVPEVASVTPHAPFTPAQRDIMRLIADFGSVTSTQAGVIQHMHRSPPCRYCSPRQHCQYASSDGLDAMKRLMRRGLVERVRDGLWRRAGG